MRPFFRANPSLSGAVLGALALAIGGFYWGGWVTAYGAERLAVDRGRAEVLAALVPICLHQFNSDRNASWALDSLEQESGEKQLNTLMSMGWATMPGSAEPNRDVAIACMNRLVAIF